MNERFTDRARKVIQLACQEAKRFNHEYVGTEHILLGLVKEGSGVAANVLRSLNIDLIKFRREVEKIIQSGPDMVTMEKLPLTPSAKQVIEYAVEESLGFRHGYVGTEHLLLGLLREQDGIAAKILTNLGATLEAARNEVVCLLGPPLESSGSVDRAPIELIERMVSFERSQNWGAPDPWPELAHLPPEVLRELKDLAVRINSLNEQKEFAVAEMDYEKAASLRDQADKLWKKMRAYIQVVGD